MPQAYCSRVLAQTSSLTKKNILSARRNASSTCVQLLVGLFFLLLMLVLKAAVLAQGTLDTSFIETPQRETRLSPRTFPNCSSVTGDLSCYSFAYATSRGPLYRNDENVELIIDRIALELNITSQRNVSGGIFAFPPEATISDVDKWILENPNKTKGVVIFENSHQWFNSTSSFNYILQTNSTADCASIKVFRCNEPSLIFRAPLQTAIDSAFASIFSSSNVSIKVDFSNFPHPDLAASFDVFKEYGSLFLFITITFVYVIHTTSIVAEKEDHLVESMKQMGLLLLPHYLSWIITTTIINTVMVGVLVFFGWVMKFDFFVKNDGFLVVITLWLSAMSFTAVGFFFASLTRRTSSARVLGIMTFLFTFVSGPLLVSTFFRDPTETYNLARIILSILPFYDFWNIVGYMIDNSSGSTQSGVSWSDITKNILPPSSLNTVETYWSVQSSLQWMVADYFIYLGLAWYFDNIIPNEYGKAKPFYFFLTPSYWGFAPLSPKSGKVIIASNVTKPIGLDPDVEKEMDQVLSEQFEKTPAVVVTGMSKQFGYWKPFRAVDSVYYSMAEGELFALLGHNGSGKSTTMNMLTGLMDVSEGDALIFGRSVRGDMEMLQKEMGVCPQHDVLFPFLTAREHLELFSKIKGFKGDVKAEAIKRLAQVKLQSQADSPYVAGFSGGMKRRLSIAIALLGDPRIVFLDEPTTGMDPVTRAEVLRMIDEAKRDRVIVLTSHSMEEVDFLSDKVAIMSHGRLQAVGTTTRLKKRFGTGYKMTMFINDDNRTNEITEFVLKAAPKGTFLSPTTTTSTLQFQLTRQEDPSVLVTFFKEFELNKDSLGILDYSVGLSTMEEVFLNLSKSAEDVDDKDDVEKASTLPPLVQKGEISTSQQFYALFMKTLAFQIRSPGSTLCVVIFPILILGAMIALDAALFAPLKFKAVCGTVNKSSCATLGPDLECVANLFESEPLQSIQNPGVIVGQIDLFGGNQGRGVNVNCDANACYEGLEKIDVRNIPISGNATSLISYSSPVINELFDFHSNLLFVLQNSTCQDAFNDALDESKCSDGDDTCIDHVRLLVEAKEYVDAETQVSNNIGLGACLRSSAQARKIPSNVTLEELQNKTIQLRICEIEKRLSFLESTDLTPLTTSITKNQLGGFDLSTKGILEPVVFKLEQEIWYGIEAAGSGISGYYGNRTEFFESKGYDPSDRQVIPALDLLCDFQFFFQIMIFLNGFQPTVNLCLYSKNRDAMRNMSTKVVTDVDPEIYSSWFGNPYQTQFMKDRISFLGDKQQYFKNHFFTKFAAFDVIQKEGDQYEVLVYHNKTAVGNEATSNWREATYLADSALVRQYTGGRELFVRFKEFPSKFKCNRDEWLNGSASNLECDLLQGFSSYSILDFVAAQLFPFLFFLHAFLVTNLIVYEKENRLRVIMKMSGLRNFSYWMVNYLLFLTQFFIMSLLVYILGNIAGLRFTSLYKDVYWLFIFSWGNLIVVFSFFLSIFFASTKTSTSAIFLLVLIFNVVGIQLVSFVILDPLSSEASYASLMVFPPFVMIRVILLMAISGGLGAPIESIYTFADGAIANTIGYMWIEFFVLIVLVWYLDNTLVAGFGVRRSPLFFLDLKYWTGQTGKRVENLKDVKNPSDVELSTTFNDDVAAEYERVVGEDEKLLVRIVRLHKRFESYVAVKSLSLGINRNECFGLLGHNGAGKTTAISCMVGLFEPTSGTATVDGISLLDMEKVQARMGVCPQHDVLWGPLTVRDHLLFYGRLKGIDSKFLNEYVDRALTDVNLKRFQHRASSKLSGGMKRRLSVAISIIGTPSVVYLDEPSTGLDPASKRALWNVIAKAKGNKSIVLTTHSMEEAEVLCDRIGVMNMGELQTIGTAIELKRRFGTGYTFFLVTSGSVETEKVHSFVKSIFPKSGIRNLGSNFGGSFKFEILREDVVLSRVFEKMESAETKEELSLIDWSLTETTLEEVFLKLAEMSHLTEQLSKEKVHQSWKEWFWSNFGVKKQSANVEEEKLQVQVKEQDDVV